METLWIHVVWERRMSENETNRIMPIKTIDNKKQMVYTTKQTKTYPGEDIGSDHNPVVDTVKINLKRIKKKENMEQFNLDMLKDEHMRQQYAVEVNNIFDCLEHEVTEQEYEKDRVDIFWTNIKEGIQMAAHSILPNIVKTNKKPWISTDILDMMEKRKRAKNTQSYDGIKRQVKRACKIAQENWLEEQCQEIENLEKQHLTRQMHEKIRRVTKRRKITQTTGIMDKHDNICFEKEALVNVWI